MRRRFERPEERPDFVRQAAAVQRAQRRLGPCSVGTQRRLEPHRLGTPVLGQGHGQCRVDERAPFLNRLQIAQGRHHRLAQFRRLVPAGAAEHLLRDVLPGAMAGIGDAAVKAALRPFGVDRAARA